MQQSVPREKVWFSSGGVRCAAWRYPGESGTCVVMAAGTGVTKEPGTDRFAERFVSAGFGVLAFDFRNFGESGGTPRQVARIADQLADWQAAVVFTRELPGVDPDRIALWGFSLSGGEVLAVAAELPEVAAVIAQTPLVDGFAASRNAVRFQTPMAPLRVFGLGVGDALGGLVGRRPILIPLAAPRGRAAVLTNADSQDGPQALDPDGRYPDWSQTLAARSSFGISSFRASRDAARVRCPLLVVVADDDCSALAAPAVDAAGRAPNAELLHVPGGHYAPFLAAHERVVDTELAFLRRHLLDARAELPAVGRG